MIELIKRWFSPELRIARKLREAAKIAGDNNYQVAHGEFNEKAKVFESL